MNTWNTEKRNIPTDGLLGGYVHVATAHHDDHVAAQGCRRSWLVCGWVCTCVTCTYTCLFVALIFQYRCCCHICVSIQVWSVCICMQHVTHVTMYVYELDIAVIFL